ncbi:hypothetical protein SAMN05443377_12243 [Propionibacterium cyclohexanicum]|mgnify:CR=1 FL=1|uniref:Uncharacterized protein n=1 Tax=Propionibacterium cyclohexanicum TaxID=64702 RepID=A0A1H9TFL2_9ACTN|nr:hypothetical protein [Propionibacterium cyclohexanicum]SER96025.1 hypothetical protein SAMN05443377_12243 [Propionibacterium cyclohexanicum]
MNVDTLWHGLSMGLALAGLTLLALGIILFAQLLIEAATAWFVHRRQARIAAIEAELDRKQEQLRRTILSLAQQLAAERDEASREMARQAILASGKTPPTT